MKAMLFSRPAVFFAALISIQHFHALAVPAGQDLDGDGLTDCDEELYSTDPYNFDTDDDGLTDYEEVVVYGTDPLLADTDGDGTTDGDEIAAETDPMCYDMPFPLPDGGPYREIVEDIEWTFMVTNDEASVGGVGAPAVPAITTGAITIPSTLGGHPVTKVGNEAFASLTEITDVIVSSNVTVIGHLAFSDCHLLRSIELPDGLIGIGTNAFSCCKSLTSITIPPLVTELQNGTFSHCTKLHSITLPDGLIRLGRHVNNSIGTDGMQTETGKEGETIYTTYTPIYGQRLPLGVFEGCSALEFVTLPPDLREIGVGAFYHCHRLASIELPESLQTISYDAFGYCENLTSVRIPPLVTDVPYGTFAHCTRLHELELPAGLERLGGPPTLIGYQTDVTTTSNTTILTVMPIFLGGGSGGAFEGCISLKTVELPDGLVELGSQSFKRCKNMASAHIPDSVELIGAAAFAECLRLKDVRLPLLPCHYGFATSPEDGVFFGCSRLASVAMPDTISEIPNYMFCGCSSLKTLEFFGDNPYIDGHEVLLGTPFDLTVCVSSDTFGWYDPVTYGRLMRWQGRRVSYDGEDPPQAQRRQDVDIDTARDELSSAIWLLQELGEDADDKERLNWIYWAQDIIEQYPELLNCFAEMLQSVGPSLTAEQKEEFSRWSLSVVSGHLTSPDVVSDTTNAPTRAYLTVTNVVVQYVLNSVQPEIAVPISGDTGFVAVITEVTSSGAVSVPIEWRDNYLAFKTLHGNDFGKSLMMKSGKKDGAGNEMFVWQDYVAGTDPTNPDDKFSASITMVGDMPVISYTPELTAEQAALRVYKTFGKKQLKDEWVNLTDADGATLKDYNFFKVTVQMK